MEGIAQVMTFRECEGRLSSLEPRCRYYVRGRGQVEPRPRRSHFGTRLAPPGEGGGSNQPPRLPPAPVSPPTPFGKRARPPRKSGYLDWKWRGRFGAMGKRAKRAMKLLGHPYWQVLGSLVEPAIMPIKSKLQLDWMMKAGGWTVKCDNGGGDAWWSLPYNGINPVSHVCGTPLQQPHGFVEDGIVPQYGPTGGSVLTVGPSAPVGGGVRFRYEFVAYRLANTTAPRYTRVPYYSPSVSPEDGRLDSLDPLRPPGLPRPAPAPIPYRLLPDRGHNPQRDRVEQSGGSQPSTPLVRYVPGRLIPAREVVVKPDDFKPQPGGQGRPPAWVDGWHSQRTPNRKEREKKLTGALPTAVEALVGAIGEAGDLLNAFFEALPANVRKDYTWKGGDPIDRFEFVVANLDKIDLVQLVANIALMLAEDAVIGKLGKAQAEQYKKLHDELGAELAGRLPKSWALPRY